MKNILDRYVNRYGRKHKDFRRYAAIVAVLALVVFVGVNWRLHDKGISMTSDYQCGLKEHKHTEKCYKKVLICGKEETDGSEGHTHTASCYKEERKLTCDKEEHKHSADCYDEEGNLICDKEEHTHSEDCYTTEKKLVCGREESKSVKAHHHTDACYKKELVCKLKEHTHTAACYSNESADVETESDWKATIPSLSGNWAEDVVSVAQSQLGYEESTANFKLADDGKTRKGYTRYGEWYGNKYGDWSAMFASFCLNYAGIPSKTVPVNSGSTAWISELKQQKLYKTANSAGGNYNPTAGDLVFLDTDSDGKADHVGIISETETKDNKADSKVTSLKAIVGDLGDKVEEKTYKTGSDVIMGYCALPENPDGEKSDVEATTEEATTAAKNKKTAESGKADEKTEVAESTTAANTDKNAGKKSKKSAKSNDAVAVQSADGVAVQVDTYVSLSPYITGLEGSGTKYDKNTGNYTSDLEIKFEISKEQIESDDYTYEFKYPEGIIVPDSLTGTYKLQDDNKVEAGNYYFVKNEDGTYSVRITFDKEYIEKAGKTVKGNLWFAGKLDGNKADDAGNIVIKGEDNVELNIPNTEITYPEDETNKYSINVSKNGAIIEGGKLKYTVTINSKKGTPGDIDFTDIIKMTGMNLGTPEVTVTKNAVRWYDWGPQVNSDVPSETITVSPTYDASTGKLTMTLPQLTAEKNNDNYIDCEQYVVTYIYDIAGMDVDTVAAKNTVDIISKNTDTNTTVKDEASKDITGNNPNTISKEAKIVDNNQIEWKIKINANRRDIAGGTLTDSMFDRIPADANIKVSPDNGYEIEYNSDGKVKDIKFKAVEDGKNSQIYTITYYTDYTRGDTEQTEENDAVFKPSDGKDVEDKATVKIPAYSFEKKVNKADIDSSKGTAEVTWTVSMEVSDTKLEKGTTISDDMTKNKDGEAGKPQYMTVDQIKNWAGQMKWDDGTGVNIFENGQAQGTFYDEQGNAYSYEDIISGKVDKDTKFTRFDIKLLKDLEKPSDSQATKLSYTYSTTADLKDTEFGKNNYYNTVSDGNKETDATYTYENKHSISKTGEVSGDKIKWTITVNDKWTDIAGSVLSDPMFSQIPAGTKLEIDPGYGYEIEYNEDGTIRDIKFNAINGKQNNTKYTITYYTSYESEWDEKKVTNDATFKPSTGKDIDGIGEVTVPGGSVDKKMDGATENASNGTAEVNWTVSLNIPDGKIPVGSDGKIIADNMTHDKDGNSGKNQYMTVAQVQAWGGVMSWNTNPETTFNILDNKQAEVKFYDAENNSYSLQDILDNKVDASVRFTHFKIKLLKDLEKPSGSNATKVTYSYKTTADLSKASTGTNNYYNTVEVDDKKADATYTYENKHTISKTAERLEDNRIKWTITVNENQVNIADAILKDTKFAEIVGEITVKPDEGYVIEKEKDADNNEKIKDIKFTAISDGKNTNKYTITYYTPYKKEWNEQDITNEATFKPTDGEEIETKKTVHIPGCSLEKTTGEVTEKDDKIEIPWTVGVEIPDGELPVDGSSEYAVITDDMTKNQSGTVVGKKQYMTVQQVLDWKGDMRWDNSQDTFNIIDEGLGDITFYDAGGKVYTYEQIKNGTNGVTSDTQFTKFEIKLKKKITKPDGATKLVYTYKTTADRADASIGANDYCNSAWIGDKNIDATYVYNKGGVVKTDGDGNTGTSSTTSENELTWKIEVTTDSKEYNIIKVADKLPDGLKLKEISVIDNSGQKIDSIKADDTGKISGQNDIYKVSGTYENGEVNLNLSSVDSNKKVPANSKYTFTVVCQTADDSKFENKKTYTFKNTATVSFDEKTIDSSDQTQEWTKKTNTVDHKTVEKSAVWDENSKQANYSILLNADAKDLVEGTDVLTLEDIFNCQKYPWHFEKADGETTSFNREDISIRAELVPAKIKLYYAEKGSNGEYYKGKEVTGWKWEYTYTPDSNQNNVQHKLTVSNIPDSTALIFEYTYAMEIDAPGKVKMVQLGNLSNTAKLMGVSDAQDGNNINKDWKESSTGGGITTERAYTIYKVEKGNFGKFLSGATFKLQKYDKTQNKYVDVVSGDNSSVQTFNTGKDGKITIKWDADLYQYNTLYHLVETKAPDNYNLSDGDSNVYFYFSDKGAANNLPDNIPTKAIDLTKKSYTAYVENESNLTDITVKKNWEDSDGNITNATSDEIKFDLYQQERDTDPADKVNVTLKYGKDWAGTVVPLVCNKGDKVVITLKNVYSKPNVTFEGSSTQLEPVSADVSGEVTTYTYEYEADKDVVICTTYGDWRNSADSFEYKVEPKQYTAKKLGEYTISKGDHWQKTIENLPLTEEKDGKTVYYTYYIKEQNESAYKKVQYANNDGINSGTITVTNTTSEAYNLPETGGSGTLPFITIGASLMGFALLCGYSLRRRRGRRVE